MSSILVIAFSFVLAANERWILGEERLAVFWAI